MRVIVAGAGEVGWYIAEKVSEDGHDVIMIDNNEERIQHVSSSLDVQALQGAASSASVLVRAGVAQADLVIAATGSDETNLVCASVARKLGAARTVARVDEVIYRKATEISYQNHFGIDELVSPEMLAALELASLVRNPGSLAVEHFARGNLEMLQLRAGRGSQYVGHALRELNLPGDVRVAVIRREGQIIIPQGGDQVEDGDLVTLIGKTDQVSNARGGFEAGKPHSLKVVILGGGHTTLSLARRLRRDAYRLTIIERDGQRCQFLAGVLPQATILHGDGTNLSFLQEERIENADFFISTTSSDETNIMSAIQAKNLGVKKSLVLIHRPDYADLVEKIGIDRAISPRVVMAHEMLAWLRKGKASTLAILEKGEAEILELVVEGEDFVGHTLRDISIPAGCLVIALLRDQAVFLPSADMVFRLGDVILVIVRQEVRKAAIRLIAGEI